jgi:hypothetical protein
MDASMVIPPSPATRKLLALIHQVLSAQDTNQNPVLPYNNSLSNIPVAEFFIFGGWNNKYTYIGFTRQLFFLLPSTASAHFLFLMTLTTFKLHKTRFLSTLPSFTDHYPHPNCQATIQLKYYNSVSKATQFLITHVWNIRKGEKHFSSG